MKTDIALAAGLLSDASRVAELDIRERQRILETMSSPVRVDIDGSELRCYVHSVTEDARVRKFKEPWTIEWLRNLPASSVLYDVGANIGITSLIAAEDGHRRIRVVAIEPAPANFASLVKNVSLNGLGDRVYALPIGVGESTGVAELHLSTFEPGGALHAFGEFMFRKPGRETRSQGVHHCLRVRLDDLVRWDGLPFPTHIKIDVDGSELDVLAGAHGVFSDIRCLGAQIEVVDRDAQAEQSRHVLAFMSAANFVLVGRHVHRFPGVTDYQFGRP